ncbi:hypothetical protein [Streptosporangium sp. NPDC050280]|uniref:hypothetical protein n=1 Tax=unclassified Streptosporangium TaxID=2632669 RepID=UPI00343C0F1B
MVRLVRDIGQLIGGATRANKQVATFAIDGEVVFASARERASFVDELARMTATLVSKYHDEHAPTGRRHRLVVALHPQVKPVAAVNAARPNTEIES